MIKPEELRIGNYFYDDVKHVSVLTGFSPFGHSVRCDEKEGCDFLYDYYDIRATLKIGYECESNYAEPIPLTEEWLIKFGFRDAEDSINGYVYDSKRGFSVGIRISDDIAYLFGVIESYWVDIPNEIKNVHQLQNLFYSLCGEELKFSQQNTAD